MTAPVPNLTGRRWQADFARNRAFVAGQPATAPAARLTCARAAAAGAENADGSTTVFPANTPRLTTRGLVIEPAATELLTNSRLLVDPNGATGLPVGWNATSTATVECLAGGELNGVGWARVRVSYTNPGSVATTVRLNLEAGNGLAIATGSGPYAGRDYAFGGTVTLEAIENGAEPSVRVTPRDSGGAIVASTSMLGRVPINAVGAAQDFVFATPFDAGVATINPGFTYAANPGDSAITLLVSGLRLVAGLSLSGYVPTTPPTVSRADLYPNPTLSGAASPTTLPIGWGLGSGLSVLSVTLTDDVLDLQLGLAAGASGTLRMSALSGSTAIPATAGQRFVGSIEATVLDNPASIAAALNLRARNSGGSAIGGVAGPAIVESGRTSTAALTCPANTVAVSLELAFSSLPAGAPTTISLRFRLPKTERLDTLAGSGPVTRDGDRVNLSPNTLLAWPLSVVIRAEHRSLQPDQTLLCLMFGARRVRAVIGERFGVLVESQIGDSWFIDADLTQPSHYVAGQCRLAFAISGTPGSAVVSVGYPDEADGGSAASAAINLAGPVPDAVHLGWSGDQDAPATADTAVAAIEINDSPLPAAALQLRTRSRWMPRHNAQPVAGVRKFRAADAAPFALPTLSVVGASYAVQTTDRNRYLSRTHTGAMSDTLPAPAATGAGPNLPWFVALLNPTAFAVTVTTPTGSINDAGSTFTLAAGQYRLFVTDGTNWVASGGAAADLANPVTYRLVEFPSIYGPPNPDDPSRSQIDLAAYGVFQSRIGPIRQQAAYVTARMNEWARSRDGAAAARCGRCLLDWMVTGDYWRTSGEGTPNDTINGQIVSNVGAYLGIRDAGVFTAAEDTAIRDKIHRWAQQMIDYRANRIALAIAARDAGLRMVTGLQNHTYSYGYALALCAAALDRADLYERAYQTWRTAVEDMQAVPGHVGALPNELVRASKGLTYQNLANIWLAGLAMVLRARGVPIFEALGGGYREIVNFTAAAVLDPPMIRAEQERLALIPISGLNSPIVPADQESLSAGAAGSSSDIPGESKTAWVWLLYRLLETTDAPWRPDWQPILTDFQNCYATNLNGGLRDALYPLLLVPEAV